MSGSMTIGEKQSCELLRPETATCLSNRMQGEVTAMTVTQVVPLTDFH